MGVSLQTSDTLFFQEARPSAIFYVVTILGLYVLGLLFILVHYMNSSYGQWAWTLTDVWDEMRCVETIRACMAV